MDLTYMPDELAFQREVRAWLKRNVPKRQRDERPIEFGDPRRIAEAKAWQRQVYEAGYLALAWPREWGGQGADVMRQTIVNEEMVGPRVRMTGDAGFNEVLFQDGRVPRASLVGLLTAGWQVANATLAHGRNMLGSTTRTQQALQRLVRLARTQRRNGGPASKDPVIRQRLAELAIRVETMKLEA